MRRFLLIASLILTALLPNAARAISFEDENALINDWIYYLPNDADCSQGSPGVSTPLNGSDNVQKAFNYFVQKGLTPIQSAGIVGNLMQESGVDPNSVQKGGPGRGIAQWSVNERWQGVLKLATATNRPPTDLGLQLDYLWQELNTTERAALSALKATSTIEDAVIQFEKKFERAGKPNYPNRIRFAHQVLNSFGGAVGGGQAPSVDSPTTGACATSGGLGVNGSFVFPLKTTQNDIRHNRPSWCFSSQTSCHHDYKAADIMIAPNTPVVAAVDGVITKVDDDTCTPGTKDYSVPRINMQGADGKYYYYTHMKPGSLKVHKGQQVTAGTDLGNVGPTECAQGTPPHLHFQISSVPITNTESASERTKYIDPQPNLVAAFKTLPAGTPGGVR
jgi:murein DD-endopeptidase MepM/ murein hydrolase activator NlpD